MKLKKSDYIIVSVGIVFLVLTMLIVGFFDKVNFDEKKNDKSNKILLLKDYSRFFTLESCIYRYISYIESRNSDSLLKVLDSNYINRNSITKDNIYDFVGNLDGMYTFSAKKIYYEKTKSKLIKYYIYGSLIEEVIDEYNIKGIDMYYIVMMDINNKTFTIEPIDSSVFSEVTNG